MIESRRGLTVLFALKNMVLHCQEHKQRKPVLVGWSQTKKAGSTAIEDFT